MKKMNVAMVVMEFQAKIDDRLGVCQFLLNAAKAMELSPVSLSVDFFPTADGRYPVGMTGIVRYLESYLILDVWPENEYAHISAVSCKPFSNERLVELIHQTWDAKNVDIFDVFKRSCLVDPHGT